MIHEPTVDRLLSLRGLNIYIGGRSELLTAGRWIINHTLAIILRISLNITPNTFPGVMNFFIWHLYQVPSVDS